MRQAGAKRGLADASLGGEQVEGLRSVAELLAAGTRPVREVWIATGPADAGDTRRGLDRRAPTRGGPSRQAPPRRELAEIEQLARARDVRLRRVAPARLGEQARTMAPQGVIAFAAPLVAVALSDLCSRTAAPAPGAGGATSPRGSRRAAQGSGAPVQPFLLVVDGVTDPGNLGALLRSAAATGVTGIVLARHRAVRVTPAVTKAAAGSIEHLRFALVGGVPAALAELGRRGLWSVGLDPQAPASLFSASLGFDPVGPIALVLGAEGRGLSRLARERCDALVAIPQLADVASLNVSVAGALACFEVMRRRGTDPSAAAPEPTVGLEPTT